VITNKEVGELIDKVLARMARSVRKKDESFEG